LLAVARSPVDIGCQANQGRWEHFNDGFWSDPKKGTFQKGISEEEIVALAARAGLAYKEGLPHPNFGTGVSSVVLGRA
ncbi:MAG TPA: hypothetical protein VH394_16310, partial [Thermoanaerobaculia bacterium]|nr:hypothetical protein [Thermoanaerobaculia bacterium]